MTIQNLYERLNRIIREAAGLSREAGFSPDEGLGEKVCHLPDICEDTFLRNNAEEILRGLEQIRLTLLYLGKPVHKEHTLHRFPNGRFGYCGKNLVRVFSSGECLEAKIYDENGNPSWAVFEVEHDGTDYCLAGYHDIPLDGLTVRERG